MMQRATMALVVVAMKKGEGNPTPNCIPQVEGKRGEALKRKEEKERDGMTGNCSDERRRGGRGANSRRIFSSHFFVAFFRRIFSSHFYAILFPPPDKRKGGQKERQETIRFKI
jgi:hypothetical protein